ncbi:uncharacterized protein SOCE26_049900 [Sorangium cellulosum]|uniref:Sulfatase N-terminal domain-containing protein n=1 Tax=Sorangium cellulosum TaxID=56 RepID=A0A2L0EW58_SORCE|nr:sulfatase-like hydrolase/transferase [Sorangium cellulosum]AUX43540.1 uncharacterized protein SOCE26_049900 [Sorangium cellulosum]
MSTPNILIIVADDLGVDALRINNGQVIAKIGKTDYQYAAQAPSPLPTLGKLLQSGIHFTRAWAQPVCSPTRASLFTGLNPWKTNVGYPEPSGYPLRAKTTDTNSPMPMLAQVLKSQKPSYRCAMFGKWDLGSPNKPTDTKVAGQTPTDWGWDHFEGIYGGGVRPVAKNCYDVDLSNNPSLQSPSRFSLQSLTGCTSQNEKAKRDALIPQLRAYLESVCEPRFADAQPDVSYYAWEKNIDDLAAKTREVDSAPFKRKDLYATADQITSAGAWIKAQTQPWLVALTITMPHDPYHVPPKGTYHITLPDNPTPQQMFIAMIESMDYYLGQLLNDPALKTQLANTVIFFVGDNGTQDADPATTVDLDGVPRDDKGWWHIGGMHVPMIVADGGKLTGGAPCYLDSSVIATNSDGLAHIMDIYRTTLDIAGASAGPATDSSSMKPYLKKTAGPVRSYLFSQQFPVKTQGNVPKHASVSDGTYKLSCYRRPVNDPTNGTTPDYHDDGTADIYRWELCKLVDDPKDPGVQIDHLLSMDDSSYAGKIRELYQVMARERLDGGVPAELVSANYPARPPLVFPPMPATPHSANPPSLNQLTADASFNYKYGIQQPFNIPIRGAPKDADLTRWSLLFDGQTYRFCCFQGTTTDALYAFAYDGTSLVYGHLGMTTMRLAGFPADTDTSYFGMLSDGESYHLCMRRLGREPVLYRATLDLRTGTWSYGQSSIPATIPVTGFPADADWGRWAVLFDGQQYGVAALQIGSNTTVYQGIYQAAQGCYTYLSRGTIVGAPANSDLRSMALINDGQYNLYFQTL